MTDIYVVETPKLKGKRSKKGKKRQDEMNPDKKTHSTVGGVGRIGALRRRNGNTRTS